MYFVLFISRCVVQRIGVCVVIWEVLGRRRLFSSSFLPYRSRYFLRPAVSKTNYIRWWLFSTAGKLILSTGLLGRLHFSRWRLIYIYIYISVHEFPQYLGPIWKFLARKWWHIDNTYMYLCVCVCVCSQCVTSFEPIIFRRALDLGDIRVYIWVNSCVHTHTHTHTHIYIYIYISLHEFSQNLGLIWKFLARKWWHIENTHTHTHTHTHTYIYIYICVFSMCHHFRAKNFQMSPRFWENSWKLIYIYIYAGNSCIYYVHARISPYICTNFPQI